MRKLLFLIALVATGLQAAEYNAFGATTRVAMGDTGSMKSSLSGEATSDTPMQSWSQLSDDERKVLAPLGSEWDTLRPWQREKMLDIAKDYPKMDAQKQQRVQARLNSWSRMTPYERENARKRYQEFTALSPEKKAEIRKKWAEHQKLRKEPGEGDYEPDLEQ